FNIPQPLNFQTVSHGAKIVGCKPHRFICAKLGCIVQFRRRVISCVAGDFLVSRSTPTIFSRRGCLASLSRSAWLWLARERRGRFCIVLGHTSSCPISQDPHTALSGYSRGPSLGKSVLF